MYYSIRHLTKFLYKTPVSESIMETRMHPRSDAQQRCLTFHLSVSPRCRVFSHRDHLSNHVHHFDIPGQHGQLVIVAESLVEMAIHDEIPRSLGPGSWDELDRLVHQDDFWEMLLPSQFAQFTPELEDLGKHLGVGRNGDPLIALHKLNSQLYEYFDYKPNTTKADSPIELALSSKAGVCQDFSHIMISLVRSRLEIPCRYVSGYLYHGDAHNDRSESSATHAWIEAFLPELGWIGFDPTNNLIAHHRHIRTAVGRDYADVPPTHGVFRGSAESELYVAVQVEASDEAPALDRKMPIPEDWSVLVERAQQPPVAAIPFTDLQAMQQQQQQQ